MSKMVSHLSNFPFLSPSGHDSISRDAGSFGSGGIDTRRQSNNRKSSSTYLTPKIPQIGSASSYFGEELIDDAQLAREMNDLTVKERERLYEDLHGVSTVQEETPEFLNSCLEQLDVELGKVPQNKRKWLDRAFFLRRSLETDRKYKLKFLRADRYNPGKAAARMAAFFQGKVELFGEDKIVKKITLDDLDPDTVQKSGRWRHVSNIRDQAGRRVMILIPKWTPDGWKENIKFAWYQMYANVDDEDTQIKGIVYVVAGSDAQQSPKNFIEYLCLGSQYLLTIPARYNGFHFCHNHPAFKSVIAMMQYALGKEQRSRTRVHYGSMTESQYALLTFGIDRRAMPLEPDGSFCMDAHEQYLAQQRQKDRAWELEETARYESTLEIPYPKPQDVLVGRGRPFQEHSGNVRYLEVVDSNMLRYQESKDRASKSAIFRDVIRYIHAEGGRFLQCKNGKWVEAPDSAAREKVSHSFRHRTPEATASAAATSSSSFIGSKKQRQKGSNDSGEIESYPFPKRRRDDEDQQQHQVGNDNQKKSSLSEEDEAIWIATPCTSTQDLRYR